MKIANQSLHQDWNEHDASGNTHLLEQFWTGLMFNHLSTKKGIVLKVREVELKLIDEFKHFLQWKTFYGIDFTKLMKGEKRKAANMIDIIEQKKNSEHTW